MPSDGELPVCQALTGKCCDAPAGAVGPAASGPVHTGPKPQCPARRPGGDASVTSAGVRGRVSRDQLDSEISSSSSLSPGSGPGTRASSPPWTKVKMAHLVRCRAEPGARVKSRGHVSMEARRL